MLVSLLKAKVIVCSLSLSVNVGASLTLPALFIFKKMENKRFDCFY